MAIIARPEQRFDDHHGNAVHIPEQPYRVHVVGVANRMRTVGARRGLANVFWLAGSLHDGKHYLRWQRYVRNNPIEKIEHASFAVLFMQHYLVKNYLLNGGKRSYAMDLLIDLVGMATTCHHSGLRDMDLTNDGRFYRIHKRPKPYVYAKRRREFGSLVNDLTVDAYIDEFLVVYRESYPKLLLAIEAAFNEAIIEMQSVVDLMKTRDYLPRKYHYMLLVKLLFSTLVDCDCTDAADWMAKHRGRHTARKIARTLSTSSMSVLADRADAWLARKRKEFANASSPINGLRDEFAEKVMVALTDPNSKSAAIRCYGPTGIGKTIAVTRAALHHAKKFKKKKILFLSPFTAILEQNSAIVREMLDMEFNTNTNSYVEPRKKSMNVLEHHSNVFIGDPTYNSHTVYDRVIYRIMNESHRSPVVFASFVRVFDMILSNKTTPNRRLYNDLVDSVIVLDECQEIPEQYRIFFMHVMSTLINDFGCTIVFCSATIPALFGSGIGSLKVNNFINVFPNNDELEFERRLDELRVVTEDRTLMSDGKTQYVSVEKLSRSITDTTLHGASSLVICGTKKSTRAVYRMCREDAGGRYRVFHLSTYMVSVHRSYVLGEIKTCLANGIRVVVVTTSLIEAGVDIDFPHVYKTANVSIASVIQGAGRGNRNGRGVGVLHLFRLPPDVENVSMHKRAIGWSTAVYDKYPKLNYGAVNHYYELQNHEFAVKPRLVDDPVFSSDGTLLSDMRENGENVSLASGLGIASYIERNISGKSRLFFRHADILNSASKDCYRDVVSDGREAVGDIGLMPGTTLGIPFAGIGTRECIPHTLTEVFIPYGQRGQELLTAIRGGSIGIDEWRELQHYMVGLYKTDFDNLAATGKVVEYVDIDMFSGISKRDIDTNDSSTIRVLVDMSKYLDDEGLSVDNFFEDFMIF